MLGQISVFVNLLWSCRLLVSCTYTNTTDVTSIFNEEITTSGIQRTFSCEGGNDNLSDTYLDRMKQSGSTIFIPGVYYHGQASKVVSTKRGDDPYLYSHHLCVNAESNPTGQIQLYDDGTNGDDVANDGIFSRSCVHYCNAVVDFNDMYGFAYGLNFDGSEFVALDPSKKGTVPYKEIDTPLTPGARSFATSHAFFFADVNGKYFPNFPNVDGGTAFSPNGAASPTGKSVVIAAMLQIFGDVFDMITVTPLEGYVGMGGIYKWQNWDRRGGPQPEQEIGNIDTCALGLTGVPPYRLTGGITMPNLSNSGEFEDWIHEVIHSVGGFEFHNIYGGARRGDGMHVPGSCTTDHSTLQGPVWDWVKGAPNRIPRLGGDPDLYGHGGVRIEAHPQCDSCDENDLAQCCSFRYENRPGTKQEMMENPELCTMSPIMQYISGFIDFNEVPQDKRTYYCMGSDTDGGCGTEDFHEKQCVIPVNDNDPNAVTSTFVQRFTLNQLVKANGGRRFPTKKFSVIRHATALVSARPPSDAEIVFYTLFWRQQEIATEPWERGVDDNNVKKYPFDAWNFHTRGHSIIHSRLHGIDCGGDSDNIPSCSSINTAVCSNQPCGPGAVCMPFDGQPLCMCREGLVGDGYECAFPTETVKYESLSTAYSISSDCFPDNNVWTQFTPESSIPPYPGGMVGYSSTSCFDFGVCPVGWRCNRKRGCLKPLSKKSCEGKGYNKGQCLAIGCCRWSNGTCLKKEGTSNACPAISTQPDPFTCRDLSTDCYFECKNLKHDTSSEAFSQEGNCGEECYTVAKDCQGTRHPEVHILTYGYYTNHEFYQYDDDGPFNIQGEDKNMYDRCFRACVLNDQKEYGSDKFLLNIVAKNDFAKIKSCNWLAKRPEAKKRKICVNKNLYARGYKPAQIVCPETCGPYLDEAKAIFSPLN